MEALVMGFALLLAKDSASSTSILLGSLVAILMILCAGLMKKKSGWILGSLLQACMIAFGVVVPLMYVMGILFAILWACAYFVGRKGEAIRAKLIAEREGKSQI
mgnify:CR=1 FL=1